MSDVKLCVDWSGAAVVVPQPVTLQEALALRTKQQQAAEAADQAAAAAEGEEPGTQADDTADVPLSKQ
jgi:hypothetical protein